MTFGRPFMVARTGTTPVPSLIDDEYLLTDGEGQQPSETPSRMGLCAYSSKLFEILADVLSTFYAFDPRPLSPSKEYLQGIVHQALEFDRRLDRFSDTIPVYLHPFSENDARSRDNVVHLQQQVLSCR
jgi:hypothetical protein